MGSRADYLPRKAQTADRVLMILKHGVDTQMGKLFRGMGDDMSDVADKGEIAVESAILGDSTEEEEDEI